MKKHWWGVISVFGLGAVAAALVRSNEPLSAFNCGALAVGQQLRALSLSGARGNIAAWTICVAVSLLPIVYILWARRKRKQVSDFLWPMTGACLFVGLYFLINPSLTKLFLPSAIPTTSLTEWAAVLPMYAALSMLVACVTLRWVGSLTDRKLIFWMRALLLVSMLFTAFCMGCSLSAAYSQPAVIPTLLASLTSDIFWLFLLDSALALLAAMEKNGWFHAEIERLALLLAARARWALIASVCSLAAQNVLVLLMGRWLSDINLSVGLLLTEMTLSCGTLLIARCLAAACRVKRDNDLMI